jgi:hypothetical protein
LRGKNFFQKRIIREGQKWKRNICIVPKEDANNLKIGQIVKAHIGKKQTLEYNNPPGWAIDKIEIINNLPKNLPVTISFIKLRARILAPSISHREDTSPFVRSTTTLPSNFAISLNISGGTE